MGLLQKQNELTYDGGWPSVDAVIIIFTTLNPVLTSLVTAVCLLISPWDKEHLHSMYPLGLIVNNHYTSIIHQTLVREPSL